MIKNEIISKNSINSLANREIKSNLNTMLLALESGKKATWQYAVAVSKIIGSEMYKEDFHDLTNFANYVNSSKATLSQYNNAVAFMVRENMFKMKEDKKGNKTPDFVATPLTVYNAYLLSTLTEVEFVNFYNYCLDNDIDFMMLSQNKLKNAIKEWKTTEETTEETTEKTTEQETPEYVNLNVDTKEKALTAIATLVKQFNISIDEIVEQIEQ